MKYIIKLTALLSVAFFATAEEQSTAVDEVLLKPLIEAIDRGGLDNLNSYLDRGGKWPRITTDSFATKNKITNQKELVALSDRLVGLLRERSEVRSSSEIETLVSEAKLYFALGEKLWKAEGYRNRVVSLLCCHLASNRCGKIIIVSRGEKQGSQRPDIFKILKSVDMLNLFVEMIPENQNLSKISLDKLLKDTPVKGDTWLEMIAALRGVKQEESTLGEKVEDFVSIRINPLGKIISKEDINSLVWHYGSVQMMHESMLPALAMYLKNGGSLEILLKEPANATKFEEIMKNGIYQFSMRPVISSDISGSSLASHVETIQSPERLSQRLFGIQK